MRFIASRANYNTDIAHLAGLICELVHIAGAITIHSGKMYIVNSGIEGLSEQSQSSTTTRQRILVASLLLFNEHGEPNTTTNQIANEVDISPGNLHYHFRRKSDLVDALLAEFQADARRVLQPAGSEQTSLDDFWVFLHVLLECTAAYRFFFRDMESLIVEYPNVGKTLRHFAKGLAAAFELHLHTLADGHVLNPGSDELHVVARNLAVIALFSERFDALVEPSSTVDVSSLQIARSILNVLKPFVTEGAAQHLEELAAHYEM